MMPSETTGCFLGQIIVYMIFKIISSNKLAPSMPSSYSIPQTGIKQVVAVNY